MPRVSGTQDKNPAIQKPATVGTAILGGNPLGQDGAFLVIPLFLLLIKDCFGLQGGAENKLRGRCGPRELQVKELGQ